MMALTAFFFAIIIAMIILVITHTRTTKLTHSVTTPTILGWLTLACGVVAVLAFVLGMIITSKISIYLLSIVCAYIAVIIGIGAFLRSDRGWPTWVGLITGAIPAIAWVIFAIGNIFFSNPM